MNDGMEPTALGTRRRLDFRTPPGTCLAAASFAFAGEAVVGASRFSYTTTTTERLRISESQTQD
uniref:Uncharacterized protein n=1 Tax=Oryza glumipatula TaxID=40148 RepID=A0A0E0ADS9_9ORYZ